MDTVQPEKRKVLVVSYLFPPIGGIGVQRALKMVKYLNDYGWQPCVLTVDPVYHATYDQSLLKQVPDHVIVERVPQTDLSAFMGKGLNKQGKSGLTDQDSQPEPRSFSQQLKNSIKKGIKFTIKKLKDYIFIPDDQMLWYLRARKKALEMIQKYDIDVIYSTSGPHSDLLLGRYVKKKTGIPWIAEFRDPWTQNMHFSATGLRRRIEEKMEARVMEEADTIVTVTHSFAHNFKKKYPHIRSLEVIHNGFDPADYRDIQPVSNGGKFTLVYTGILYGKRNPRLFLKALHQLLEEGSLDRCDILVKFAGVFDYPGYTENQDCVNELGISDIVEVLGYLPHKTALSHLKGADVQLLIGDTAPESGDYIPGKLFEYMALKKPILALSLPGETTKIIEKYQLGKSVDPLDISAIKAGINEIYCDWKQNNQVSTALSETEKELAIYQRDEQARQLAEIMSNLMKNKLY